MDAHGMHLILSTYIYDYSRHERKNLYLLSDAFGLGVQLFWKTVLFTL